MLGDPPIIVDKVTPFHDIGGLGWQIQQIVFFDKFMFNKHFGHFYECMVIIGRLYVMQYAQENDVIYHPKSYNVMETHCLENQGKYVNLKEEWVYEKIMERWGFHLFHILRNVNLMLL